MTPPPRPRVPKDRCYWHGCEEAATTDDHVPPRVFFFEGTDIDGEDLKKNRFTVRSCVEHNQTFSDDEEYVAVIAYMALENDPAAHRHALERQFDTLRKKVNEQLGRRIGASFQVSGATVMTPMGPGSALRVELPAIRRVGEKIARGLHYRLTGERLQGEVRVWAPNFAGGTPEVRTSLRNIGRSLDMVPFATGVSGHPLVFEYAHFRDPMARYVSMKFRFFRGFELRALALSPWRTIFDDLPVSWPPADSP